MEVPVSYAWHGAERKKNSPELSKYVLEFGLSLYDGISVKTLAAIKELRKTSSDYASCVEIPKRQSKVKPASLTL